MRKIVKAIHSLPEDARKLLAGFLIVIVAFGFFGMWGSFMSSRLVALGPPPASPLEQKISLPPVTARLEARGMEQRGEPPSPTQGLVRTFSGFDELWSPGRDLLAAIGGAVAGGIEFLYLKLSRYIPPNL